MAKVKIDTTQNVRLEYEPASVGDRILATLIDALIMYGFVISVVILVINFRRNLDESMLVMLIVVTVIPLIFYHLLSEIFLNGQSIGKKARKIKILKLDGTEPTLSAYFLRWLIRPIDLLFYGLVGIITISANNKGQRLGDIAAGTTVVKLNKPVTLQDLILFADEAEATTYQPTYWEVTHLSEKDFQIIQNALEKFQKQKNMALLAQLANKVKEHLQIENQAQPVSFLKTIARDYIYFTSQE